MTLLKKQRGNELHKDIDAGALAQSSALENCKTSATLTSRTQLLLELLSMMFASSAALFIACSMLDLDVSVSHGTFFVVAGAFAGYGFRSVFSALTD